MNPDKKFLIFIKVLYSVKSVIEKCNNYKNSILKNLGREDLRTKCYDALVDYLEYYSCIMALILNSNQPKDRIKRWIPKAWKQLLISILSVIEYSMRNIIKCYPSSTLYLKLSEWNRRGRKIYLKDVINISHDLGIIDEEGKNNWLGIIEIRNLLIHNNAICESEESLSISDLEIKMEKGKPIKMNFQTLLRLIEITIDGFHEWNRSMLDNYGKDTTTFEIWSDTLEEEDYMEYVKKLRKQIFGRYD